MRGTGTTMIIGSLMATFHRTLPSFLQNRLDSYFYPESPAPDHSLTNRTIVIELKVITNECRINLKIREFYEKAPFDRITISSSRQSMRNGRE